MGCLFVYNNLMRINIRQLFIYILFIGLFIMALRPVADPDFWWHLKTGQLILQTHSIPHSDPFSFTNQGRPWIAHEWLAESLIFGLYSLGHYGILIFTFAIIITAAFLLVYLRCPSPSQPYIAGFTLILGAVSTAPTWGVRPQMISLVFSSLFFFLLDQYFQKKQIRCIIPLPFVTIAWVNLHAGYFLGLAIIGLYLSGGALEWLSTRLRKGPEDESPSLRTLLILFGILVAAFLATLVNPNGVHIIAYPFQTLSSPSMQKLIVEWFSPDFHQAEWLPLAFFILLLVGAGLASKKTASLTNILCLVAFGFLALRSMRNVPFFVLAATPVLADQISSLIPRINPETRTSSLFRWIAPILLAFAVLTAGLRFVQVTGQQQETERASFPAAAVDWIAQHEPEGNLLNTYGWGGYLIWRLHPTYLVYIDGRADVYGDAFIFYFIQIQDAYPGWETTLEDQKIRTILLEPGIPLVNALRISPRWKIGFEDKSSIVFVHK